MRHKRKIRMGMASLLGSAMLLVGSAATAEHLILEPDFTTSCWINPGETIARVTLRGCNDTTDTLFGLTPENLIIEEQGTATATLRTLPGWRRSMVVHNCVNFHWLVELEGCGIVDFSGEITAENVDGVTVTTGVTDCGELIVGGPECADLESPTPTATRTPRELSTLRPTLTPLPTATPRPDLPTPTPRQDGPDEIPTPTPRGRLDTPTPRPDLPTPTPRPRLELPTRTPRPELATPTPRPTLPRPELPTLRPTRTPVPTNTPEAIDPLGLEVTCTAINPHSERVTVTMEVSNNTGGDVFDVVPNPIEIETTGTVEITSLVGPTPRIIPIILDRHRNRFSWDLTASGEGSIFIHVSAVGVTAEDARVDLGGGGGGQATVIVTRRVECNTITVPMRLTP